MSWLANARNGRKIKTSYRMAQQITDTTFNGRVNCTSEHLWCAKRHISHVYGLISHECEHRSLIANTLRACFMLVQPCHCDCHHRVIRSKVEDARCLFWVWGNDINVKVQLHTHDMGCVFARHFSSSSIILIRFAWNVGNFHRAVGRVICMAVKTFVKFKCQVRRQYSLCLCLHVCLSVCLSPPPLVARLICQRLYNYCVNISFLTIPTLSIRSKSISRQSNLTSCMFI